MSNSIIVPIAAQVVVASEEKEKFNLSTRINDNNILGENQQLDLEKLFIDKAKLEKGIHLHWKLPKALKHGIADDNGDIQFPSVPNRWMVVRYKTNSDKLTNIPSKTWLIKSDEIKEQEKDNWVVLEEVFEEDATKNDGATIKKQKYIFKTIGTSKEWNNGYKESESNAVKLTAVGAFNPYFSEIYDDSRNVFGFWDDMKDEKMNDCFTYVIIGWYSNLDNDPCASNTKVNAAHIDKIKKLWKTKDEQQVFERSIYTTTVQNIVWNKNNTIEAVNESVNVALGLTTTEAFSALLANLKRDTTSQLDNTEVYLNALQNHLLENEKETTSIEKLKIENHKKQFAPKQRGFLWHIKKLDKNNFTDKENALPHFPNDTGVVTQLKSLNIIQVEYNSKQEKLKSLQQEYYFCWYKKVLLNTTRVTNSKLITDSNEKDLESYTLQIDNLKKEIETIKLKVFQEITTINSNNSIQTQLETKPNADYELIQEAEDRFWEPNDPAILLYGEGLKEAQEYNQAINKDIICRLSSEILEKANINNLEIKTTDFSINDFKIDNNCIPHSIIKKLVYESLLLNIGLARLIAQKLEGSSRAVTSEIIVNLANNTVIPFQKEAIKKISEFGIQEHNHKWIPQFLAWEVTFLPNNSSTNISIKGFNPISNGVTKNLNEQFLPNNQHLYNNVLTQSLSGFNKQLIAQIPYLQLPPLEYELDEEGDFTTNFSINQQELTVLDNQGTAYKLACNPSQKVFSPIRNGILTLKNIALVDTFGNTQTIIGNNIDKNIIISEGLKDSENSNTIVLKNNVIQASRLQFNWLNTKNEILTQDTGKLDNPIIGWLVPNYLDNSLLIYDALGQEIKAIRITDKGKLEEFFPAIDGILSNEEMQSSRTIGNPELNEIVNNLDVKLVIENSRNLNQKIKKSITSNTILSLLYGQPIAIARGEIRIELLGEPNRNPLWDKNNAIDNGAIENHAINIAIGKSNLLDDGLLGYYLNDDYLKLMSTENSEILQITPNNKPTRITVLCIANAGFYIDTNAYLPTKYITLHQHAVEELIKDINISFMLCPFMADRENPRIPIPSTQNSTWNWIHKSNIDVWHNPEEVIEQNNEETFNFNTQQFYEGWVKVNAFQEKKK